LLPLLLLLLLLLLLFYFLAIQVQERFCDVGVQCNIERRHWNESASDIVDNEYVTTEEESDCEEDTDFDTYMLPTEIPASSEPDTPE